MVARKLPFEDLSRMQQPFIRRPKCDTWVVELRAQC
jgi:hypothetical protein